MFAFKHDSKATNAALAGAIAAACPILAKACVDIVLAQLASKNANVEHGQVRPTDLNCWFLPPTASPFFDTHSMFMQKLLGPGLSLDGWLPNDSCTLFKPVIVFAEFADSRRRDAGGGRRAASGDRCARDAGCANCALCANYELLSYDECVVSPAATPVTVYNMSCHVDIMCVHCGHPRAHSDASTQTYASITVSAPAICMAERMSSSTMTRSRRFRREARAVRD